VGRDDELATVAAILAKRTSELVLVAGEAGMGKSAFLGELGTRAAADGWTVAQGDGSGELAITPSVTAATFDRRLRQRLQIGTAPAGAEANGNAALARQARNPPKEGDLLTKIVGGVRSLVASWPGLADLVRDLGTRAPVLILIDGYRPSEPFERSFVLSLLPALRPTGPIVVVIAESERTLGTLLPIAAVTLRFGPVEEAAILRYFQHLSGGVDPPLSARELEEYARAARRNPHLIGSLTRLLALDGADGCVTTERPR
jgi:hypothetical protein